MLLGDFTVVNVCFSKQTKDRTRKPYTEEIMYDVSCMMLRLGASLEFSQSDTLRRAEIIIEMWLVAFRHYVNLFQCL